MLTVTCAQLHQFLMNGGPDMEYTDWSDEITGCAEKVLLNETVFTALRQLDIKQIIADSAMSEHHLGGDDMVILVDDVLAAQRDGYAIATWYGENAEALVVGYRPDQLKISKRRCRK